MFHGFSYECSSWSCSSSSRRHHPSADSHPSSLLLADDGLSHGEVDCPRQLDSAVVHVVLNAGAQVLHAVGKFWPHDLATISSSARLKLVNIVGVLIGCTQHHHLEETFSLTKLL